MNSDARTDPPPVEQTVAPSGNGRAHGATAIAGHVSNGQQPATAALYSSTAEPINDDVAIQDRVAAAARACSHCGRSRVELNYDTVETEDGRLVPGALFCLRCHLECHEYGVVPLDEAPRRKHSRQPSRPAWVTFRYSVIAALERDGTFEYIDADRIAGRCPICGEPLLIRFAGRAAAADFVCIDGCEERHVVAMLGNAGSPR